MRRHSGIVLSAAAGLAVALQAHTISFTASRQSEQSTNSAGRTGSLSRLDVGRTGSLSTLDVGQTGSVSRLDVGRTGVLYLPAQDGQRPGLPVPPSGQSDPQTTFRAGVDVIQLDVSVLDKNRRPVRGLTAADFTVLENGKSQRIVATSEVDALENDPLPTAWMRHVPRDVASNDLGDQLGDGRLFGIVLDDVNLPDDADIAMAARSVARYVVDQLGPSDVAAVVFPLDAGKTQDFTDDRSKLLAAIDRFDPHVLGWVEPTPMGPGPIGGDIRQSSPVLMRSRCLRSQPAIPTIDTVVARLATVPRRRKTLILVSVGVPLSLAGGRGCSQVLADEMRDVFRKAQRANVNIYGIDPAGNRGYEDYLARMWVRTGRSAGMDAQRVANSAAQFRHEFLTITAENTGGRAVINADPIESSIARIFEEDASYYLVGYQTSNGNPDGKFRRVEVKVNRPDVTIRARSGYWAPRSGSATSARSEETPTALDLGLSGLMSPQALALRANAVAVARASPDGRTRDAEIAVVLTARLPPLVGTMNETATVIRNVYDENSRPGPPVREIVTLTLQPRAGDELRYDMFSRLTLAPGRYQIRYNVHSRLLDKSGSVYADIEVPDFTSSMLALSSLTLGSTPASGTARTDALAAILPIVPTSARDFAPSDHITSFVRVFQGGTPSPVPVSMGTQVLDIRDAVVFETASVLPAEDFDVGRSAGFTLDLPLDRLSHGPYLLSMTAKLPGGRSARRDLVFRVR